MTVRAQSAARAEPVSSFNTLCVTTPGSPDVDSDWKGRNHEHINQLLSSFAIQPGSQRRTSIRSLCSSHPGVWAVRPPCRSTISTRGGLGAGELDRDRQFAHRIRQVIRPQAHSSLRGPDVGMSDQHSTEPLDADSPLAGDSKLQRESERKLAAGLRDRSDR